jgi:hypothetical protein
VNELGERPSPADAGPAPAVGDAVEQLRQRQVQNARLDGLTERLDGLGVTVAAVAAQLSVLAQKHASRDDAYRRIVYGIIDGLRTVHAQADGLEDVPVQNFATLAPEYFAEDPMWQALSARYVMRFAPRSRPRLPAPAATPARAPEPEREPEPETEPEPEPAPEQVPEPEQEPAAEAPLLPPEEPTEHIFFPACFGTDVRRRSGLLHLVGHAGKRPRDPVVVVQNRAFAPEEPLTTQTPTFAVRAEPLFATERIVVADIAARAGEAPPVPAGVGSETLRELRFMVGSIAREKNEIISALDRKVDREFVERLFNKFRTMLVAMNERIRELAAITERCASQKDVKAVAQLVCQIPELNETAASRVGPECLICGRTRGQVGGVTPREEDEAAIHYVYGDGGMFRKTAGAVGRIGLPPLKPA